MGLRPATRGRFRISYNAPHGQLLKQTIIEANSASEAKAALRAKFDSEHEGSGAQVNIISVVEIVS